MRETAQDLSTTQKLCIICSRQNFETVQILCSVFCQPSTIFMLFSWFFFFGRPSFFHPSFSGSTLQLLSLRDKLCMPGIVEPNKLNWPSYVRANVSTHIIFCESIHAFQHAFMRPFMRKVRLDLQERVI